MRELKITREGYQPIRMFIEDNHLDKEQETTYSKFINDLDDAWNVETSITTDSLWHSQLLKEYNFLNNIMKQIEDCTIEFGNEGEVIIQSDWEQAANLMATIAGYYEHKLR